MAHEYSELMQILDMLGELDVEETMILHKTTRGLTIEIIDKTEETVESIP